MAKYTPVPQAGTRLTRSGPLAGIRQPLSKSVGGGTFSARPAHDRAPRASDGDLEDETKARDLFEVLGAKGKQEELKPRLKCC